MLTWKPWKIGATFSVHKNKSNTDSWMLKIKSKIWKKKLLEFGNSSKVLETFIKLLLSMASQIQHISVMSCQQNFFFWKYENEKRILNMMMLNWTLYNNDDILVRTPELVVIPSSRHSDQFRFQKWLFKYFSVDCKYFFIFLKFLKINFSFSVANLVIYFFVRKIYIWNGEE